MMTDPSKQVPKQHSERHSEQASELPSSHAPAEGVIKFNLNWHRHPLAELDVHGLNGWRRVLTRLGLLGQDPHRYQGLGFGNLSQKTAQGFIITGSQTGALEHLQPAHFSEVTGWKLEGNRIDARGLARPSSESLTHAAVYQVDPGIGCVFHVHSPDIWQMSDKLGLASTAAEVDYGSAAMAGAVKAIVSAGPGKGLLAMKGHEDGIVAWGGTLSETGGLLVDALSKAYQMEDL